VGANDELIFDGHSVALDAHGEMLALGRGFAEDILVVDLAAASPRNIDFPPREQLLFSALSLGIRDYVRKCGFKSVLLGLSGGIDSALIAVLAADALGPENVFGVALPARYSSEGSLTDAGKLAKNLGIRYEVLPIEPVFNRVEAQLKNVFAGTKPNEAEENIQSRLRGVHLDGVVKQVWRPRPDHRQQVEMAVGYCTLYGDMNGAHRTHCRRVEDGCVPDRPLGEPRTRDHPLGFHHQTAQCRTAARPEGPGLFATI